MFTEIPVIVAIIGALMVAYKAVVKDEKYVRIIPLIGAALGAVLGIVAFYAAPDVVSSHNILEAILHGLVSGLAATGIHQIFKQITGDATETDGTAETSGEMTDTGSN